MIRTNELTESMEGKVVWSATTWELLGKTPSELYRMYRVTIVCARYGLVVPHYPNERTGGELIGDVRQARDGEVLFETREEAAEYVARFLRLKSAEMAAAADALSAGEPVTGGAA